MPRKFRNPYRKTAIAEPTAADAGSLERIEVKSGAGKPVRRIPALFEQRQRAAAVDLTLRADASTRRFTYAMAERAVSSQKVLEAATARAKRAPSRRNLERMGSVINEVARRRGGGRLVREMVTQELVDELSKEG